MQGGKSCFGQGGDDGVGQAAKSAAAFLVKGQIDQCQHLGQEKHGQANDKDNEGVLGGSDAKEGSESAHGDSGQAGLALVPEHPVKRQEEK